MIPLVEDQVGVDRVPVVAGARLDDGPLVDPRVIEAFGVERGVGGQADGGVVAAEARDGIVEVVATVEVRDIRRPEVRDGRHLLTCPAGQSEKDAAAELPTHQVF